MSEHDKHLEYVSAPAISADFTREFERLVPPQEGIRKLRFVWGMDRVEFCGGHWERRYGDTQNTPPKYVGRDCWVIEGHQPPSIYNRAEWERQKHLLGAWPENGVWDFLAFHVDNKGDYLPLDQSALNHVQIWAHWQGKGREASVKQLLDAKLEIRKRRYKERKEAAEKVAMEFGERVVKHFENAKATPTVQVQMPPGFSKTESGLILPNN